MTMAAKKKGPKKPKAAAPTFEIKSLGPADLELDPHNPRLSKEEEGCTQEKLIELMLERFNIDELAESIIATGYVPFDPLVGYQHGANVRILEGNRRVATVKLLLNPALAPEKYRKKWQDYRTRLEAHFLPSIQSLAVQVYATREEVSVASYIGYRHVTGVLTWPALEKAKYIAGLVERFEWSYEEIAERLGTSRSHVERHYVAFQIVRQAADWSLPGVENMEQSFGVLVRALQAAGVAEFLGVTYPNDPDKSKHPIPSKHKENFGQFVEWTFGTEEKKRVLPESRDLTKWGKILKSANAVAYLKRTPEPDFERAWLKSGGQEESVAQALLVAADRLEESVPLVVEFKDSKEIQGAVGQCTSFLTQILAHFPGIRKQFGVELTNV